MTDVDLRTEVGSVRLKNPVLLASGTAGYGEELSRWIPLDAVGGIITKGTSLEPWPGNPTPRTVETPAGMLNSIGLENPGVEAVLRHHLPALAQVDTRVIVNIVGRSVEEYAAVARALSLSPRVDALEVNISCPNVKAGGMSFGTDPEQAAAVVRAVRAATSLPIWVKLSPNVTDIVAMARAVAAAGADALSLINTLVGMVIDTRLRRPALATGTGGLSGPAIRPIAVRMVWQVAQAVPLPIIGLGGIVSGNDAVEFLLAGASAVAVGSGTFRDPRTALQVVEGIRSYLENSGGLGAGPERGPARVRDLVGAAWRT